MSINTEINLLENTKEELCVAIMEKGVTVYSNDLFSTYPTRISQIPMTSGDKDNLFRTLIEKAETELTIPEGTTKIEHSRFQNVTTLTSVTIPSSVKIIGYYAFNGCTSLQSITCLAITPPILSSFGTGTGSIQPFDDTNNCPIYVPEESVQAYKTAWLKYTDRLQAMPEPVVTKQIFVPVQSTSDVTTGKYILVNSTAALNASLIKQTTSNSNGINNTGSSISLNNSYCHYGNGFAFVPRNEFADAATFDYDALTEKLYWVDKSDNDTKYYLTPYNNSDSYFRYSNHSTVPSTNIFAGLTPSSRIAFKSNNTTGLGYYSNRYGWVSVNYITTVIYKLVDVAAIKTADVTLTDSTTGEIFDYNNTSAPMIDTWDTRYYISQIASVRINDNVTELGESAFYGNTHLTSVNIPDNVTSIGNYAFGDCTALATVTIGTGIQSIADQAFGGYDNTSNLTSVTVKATTPPTLGYDVFNDSMSGEIINPNLVIYVPSASVDAYKSAWSEYADRIQAIPS